MTPQQYCQSQIKKGSSLHYSLYFLPSDQRDVLLALLAFFREIKEIGYECSQQQVAYVKFQWWLEEITQTFTGKPSHPVCRALKDSLINYPLAKQDFFKIIEGFLLDSAATRYNTFQEIEHYCKRTSGKLSVLCSQVMGYHDSNTLKYAERLGIALELTHRLRYLRRDVQHGRIYFSQEDLEKFSVSEQAIFRGQTDGNVQSLYEYQVARIRAYYREAFRYLKETDCLSQQSGIIRAQLALSTLREMEHDKYQLFQHHITLPSWRKWWITWRTRWQIKRGGCSKHTLIE